MDLKPQDQTINIFKTGKNQADADGEVFKSDEFNNMYMEHVRRKEEIRARIEAMTREKNFLEQLKPEDVSYMFQKKQEQKLKEQEQAFDTKMGLDKKDKSISPTKVTPQDRVRRFLTKTGVNFEIDTKLQLIDEKNLSENERGKLLQERYDMQRQLNDLLEEHSKGVYESMPDEEILNNNTLVQNVRRDHLIQLSNLQRIKKPKNDDTDEEPIIESKQHKDFPKALKEYHQKLWKAELERQEIVQQLAESHLILRYLVTSDREADPKAQDAKKAYEQEMQNLIKKVQPGSGEEGPRYNNLSSDHLDVHFKNLHEKHLQAQKAIYYAPIDDVLRDVKTYSHLLGDVQMDEYQQALDKHQEKLNKYRNQKNYMRWVQEDEEDIEGEKVYADSKNLGREKFFNKYYIDPETCLESVPIQRLQ